MKLEEVERIVAELDPSDQMKLAEGIWRQLRYSPPREETFEERRARRLAVIARCDELAGPDGDRDSVEDLRIIRDKRMADIG